MLEELLLALKGAFGSVFIEKHCDDNFAIPLKFSDSFEINPNVYLLHPSEIAIIERLCKLGCSYNHLTKYIKKSGGFLYVFQSTDDASFSLYKAALGSGLDEVLVGYRKRLVSLEKELLSDSPSKATFLLSQLTDYEMLFGVLLDLVREVERSNAVGGQILSIVYNQSQSGVEMIKLELTRVLQCCNQILAKQMLTFMLTGSLDSLECPQEFFVRKAKDFDATSGQHSKWDLVLQSDLLPNFIPARVADTVLFVGRSVHLFHSWKTPEKSKQKQPREADALNQAKLRRVLCEELERVFCVRLGQQIVTFDPIKLETAVQVIRGHVAYDLWVLLNERTNIRAQVQTLKDLFLLGKGELFLAFIELASSILTKVVGKTSDQEINFAFRKAVASLYLDDPMFDRVTLSLKPQQSTNSLTPSNTFKHNSSVPAWQYLKMIYKAPWPLNLIIDDGVQAELNELFSFLLRVRRVQMSLHDCWLEQKRQFLNDKNANRSSGFGNDSTSSNLMDTSLWLKQDQYRKAWQLRMLMLFLVDNLQYYLQVDVLESFHNELLKNLASLNDFEKFEMLIMNYLKKLKGHCFLQAPLIYECVIGLLDTCEEYAGWCAKGFIMSSTPSSLLDRSDRSSKLQELYVQFQRRAALLFRILSNVKTHQSNPFLVQLLMRIDYNCYFSFTEFESL